MKMNLNEKFAKALEDSLNFKGVTICEENSKLSIHLDEIDDSNIAIDCSAVDGYSFLYALRDMLKNGEVELAFKGSREINLKNKNYLEELDI